MTISVSEFVSDLQYHIGDTNQITWTYTEYVAALNRAIRDLWPDWWLSVTDETTYVGSVNAIAADTIEVVIPSPFLFFKNSALYVDPGRITALWARYGDGTASPNPERWFLIERAAFVDPSERSITTTPKIRFLEPFARQFEMRVYGASPFVPLLKYAFTSSAATDIITVTSTAFDVNDFADGCQVVFSGTVSTGMVADQIFYMVNTNAIAQTFKIANTFAAPPNNLTSDGSGYFYVVDNFAGVPAVSGSLHGAYQFLLHRTAYWLHFSRYKSAAGDREAHAQQMQVEKLESEDYRKHYRQQPLYETIFNKRR